MPRTTIAFLTLAFGLLCLATPLAAQDPLEEATRHRPVTESAPGDTAQFEQQSAVWAANSSAKREKGYWKGVWIATWAAFVAVNVLDAHSSAGRREANPFLRDANGLFSGRRAIVVKSAAGGGFFALQAWLAHKTPGENHYKTFAIATGAVAAGLGAVAVRNFGVAPAAAPQAAPVAPEYILRQP